MSTTDRTNVTVAYLREQIDKVSAIRDEHTEVKAVASKLWAEYQTLAGDIMSTMMALDLKKMDGVKCGKVFYWKQTNNVKVPKGSIEFDFLNEELQKLGRDPGSYLTIHHGTANALAKELAEENPDIDLTKVGFDVNETATFGMRKG